MNSQTRSKQQNPIFLTSAMYRYKLSLSRPNSAPTSDEIYSSLRNYQKVIQINQGIIKLLNFDIKKKLSTIVFQAIGAAKKLQLDQDEREWVEKAPLGIKLEQQLCEAIELKIQDEDQEAKQLIEGLKEQYYDQEKQIVKNVYGIVQSLRFQVNKKLAQPFSIFKQINQKKKDINNKYKGLQKNGQVLKRSLIKNMIFVVDRLFKKQIQNGFKGICNISDQIKRKSQQKIQLSLKQKGKKLNDLKCYPQSNLKKVLWRWYLNTSDRGQQLFVRAANKLVLYTNINKITAFYRLMADTKGLKKRIHPRVKRMATIVYVYSKLFFQRIKKQAFNKMKQKMEEKKKTVAFNLIKMAEMRTRFAFGIWYRNRKIQEVKQQEKIKVSQSSQQIKNKKKLAMIKLIQCSIKRQKMGLKLWKNYTDMQKQKYHIKMRILRKFMGTRIGRIKQAYQKIKLIPARQKNINGLKANKFQKNLHDFVCRTLRRSFEAFKHQYDIAQNLKKRAVIQLISCTTNGRNRMFNRWKELTERDHIMQKCRRIGRILGQLNFVIKSVADNAFVLDSHANSLKEQAIRRIFAAMQNGLADTFRKWRQLNRAEKLRKGISKENRKYIVKLIENLLQQNKRQQLRDVIEKFRVNHKLISIQKQFLRRLLMSKAGRVVTAFRTIASLPRPRNSSKDLKANIFEKGLSQFANRVLRKSFESYKDDYIQAQNLKRQAVIQMINCTMNGRKRMYNRWKQLSQNTHSLIKLKAVYQIFNKLRNKIKQISDSAFLIKQTSSAQKYLLLSKILARTNPLRQSFLKWRQISIYLKLQQLFKHSTHILSRNALTPILSSLYFRKVKIPTVDHRLYGLDQVQYLVKYILHLLSKRKNDLRSAIHAIKSIPIPSTRVNPWFKRSTQILCLNTRINMQKSFWRIMFNSQSSGIAFNAAVIVKLKKMYNNIKKNYILNMYHGFLMIDRKASLVLKQMENDQVDGYNYEGQPSSPKSKSSFSYIEQKSRHSAYYQERIDRSNLILPQLNAELSYEHSKKISISITTRIFSKFLKKRVETWLNNTIPTKKYTQILQASQYQIPQSLLISRLGALESLYKLVSKLTMLTLSSSFYTLRLHPLLPLPPYSPLSSNLNPNQLICQLTTQNQSLLQELQQKQKLLQQADNMISVLSLRNNYIITHKFIVTIENVWYNATGRLMDQGFDAIMEEANRDYEEERGNGAQ